MPADDMDAEFDAIRWQAHSWRARLDDELATQADHAAFEDWLAEDSRHADEYERIDMLWSTLGGIDTADLNPEICAAIGLAERPEPSAGKSAWRAGRFKPRLVAGGALAALAASVLFAVLPMSDLPGLRDSTPPPAARSYASGRGEIEKIRLPDGSVLTLGADSAIDVMIGPDSRAVTLTRGEVYFDVASDANRPFRVRAGKLDVEVTGTEFNIRLGRSTVDVGVTEGVVNVSYPSMTGSQAQKSEAVHEGFAITADRAEGLGDARRVQADKVAAWRGGRLAYSGTPLADVIADANRYSAVPIRIADSRIGDIKVSGSFDAAEIDSTLDTLAETFPIRIDRSADNVIRITAAGS